MWTSGSGRFAAFRRASRAGAAGNESIGQIIRMYILEYTLIYRQQTSISSGILTTWYKHVCTCLNHVRTCFRQCYCMYTAETCIYKSRNVYTCIYMVCTKVKNHKHVCTWYVHGMYNEGYKHVCTLFRHVCTCLYIYIQGLHHTNMYIQSTNMYIQAMFSVQMATYIS